MPRKTKKEKASREDLHNAFMTESEEWFRIRSLTDAMRKHAKKIEDLANLVDQDLARRGVKMDADYHIPNY